MRKKDQKDKVIKFPSNNNKDHKKNSLKPILSLLIGAVVIVFFLSGIRSFFITRFVSVEAVVEEQHDHILENLSATLQREERIIKAPFAGEIYQKVEDGTRVKRGQTVVSYENEVLTDNSWNSSGELQADIQKLSEDFIEELELLRTNVGIDADPGGVAEKLQEKITRMHQVSESQENSREDALNYSNEQIVAPDPGIVSFHVDGFEDRMTSFTQLSPERLQHYRDLYQQSDQTTREVVTRAPLFKLVEDYTWRAIIEIPDKDIELSPNSSLKADFEFADSGFISGEIIEVKKFEYGYLAVVEFDREINDYWKYRFTDVDVVIDTDTGFIVPETAIVDNDEGDTGVYQVERGVVSHTSVEKYTELEDDQVLVTGLDEGDLILENTFLVREGDRIR